MKKLVWIVLLVSGSVMAGHLWQKQSTWEDSNGKIVCQWECGDYSHDRHSVITSGYGVCPVP